jgi:hypothetical protein
VPINSIVLYIVYIWFNTFQKLYPERVNYQFESANDDDARMVTRAAVTMLPVGRSCDLLGVARSCIYANCLDNQHPHHPQV